MQYSIVALFTLVAAVMASPSPAAAEHNKFIARQANAIQGGVPVSEAAMTDRFGNVIPFDTTNVYLDSAARGL